MKRMLTKKLPLFIVSWIVIIGMMLFSSPAFSKDRHPFPAREKTRPVHFVRHGNVLPAIVTTGLIAGITFSLLNQNHAPAYRQAAPPSGSVGVSQWVAGGSVVVTAELLNVRSGPGPNEPCLRQIPRGTMLSVVQITGGWYYVSASDGLTGWVMTRYTTPVAAPASG